MAITIKETNAINIDKTLEHIDYDKRNSIKYIGGLVLSAVFAACSTTGNRQLTTPSVTIDQIVKPGKEGFLSDENIKNILGAFPFKVQSTEQILEQLGNITMLSPNDYYNGLKLAKEKLNKDSVVYMFDPYSSFSKYGALSAMDSAAKNNRELFGMNLYFRQPDFEERNKLLTIETNKLQVLDSAFKAKRDHPKAGVNERKIFPVLLVYKNGAISDVTYQGPENPMQTRSVAQKYNNIILGSKRADGKSLSDIH